MKLQEYVSKLLIFFGFWWRELIAVHLVNFIVDKQF